MAAKTPRFSTPIANAAGGAAGIVIALLLVLAVAGGGGYWAYNRYYKKEPPRTKLASLKVKEEVVQFTHDRVSRALHHNMIALDDIVVMMDKELKRVFGKRVSNDLPLILKTLDPFQDQLQGLAVESTYNWYWLVDGLMDAGYQCVHLANPSAVKQYEGLKHSDDQHDSFFLAQMLILGILPQGYIYPK